MKYFIPLLLTLLVSCSQGKNGAKTDSPEQQAESIELQMKKVMAVHDSIMPWMDHMHALQQALDAKNDEARMNDESPNGDIEGARAELEAASEAMMLWMSEFKPEEFEKDKSSLMEYLEEEEEKISNVGEQMKASIESAEAILNEE